MTTIGTVAVVRVKPEDDMAVTTLAQEAMRLRDYALVRVVATDDDLIPATDDLSLIAKVKKRLAECKAGYLQPIKAHLDTVAAAFASVMAPLEEADRVTRGKVNAYRVAQQQRQAEAEAINRQKEELARREAEFSGTGETTVDLTPVVAPAPVRRVTTDSGATGTMVIRKWEVQEFALVPDDYKVLDAGKITRIVKAGGNIPGIKTWTEETLRVTAR